MQERAPVIATGDYLIFEDGKLVEYKATNLVPAAKTRQNEVKQAPFTRYNPKHTFASFDSVMSNAVAEPEPETGPETHPDVNHSPPPIPVIKITDDDTAGGTQSSSGSSHFQDSCQDTQEPQDTPDSTYFSQSQDPFTQSQGRSGQQAIDPKDLLQPPAPAARKKKTTKALKKPVEINPRRSARLAEKNPTPAPKAPAPMAPPPVLNPSVKRDHGDDVEGEDEDERGGRNKKVVSKAAVEKQRETRRGETAKRGGRDRRTELQRRGV